MEWHRALNDEQSHDLRNRNHHDYNVIRFPPSYYQPRRFPFWG